MSITVHNQFDECIVVVTYNDFDSVQLIPTSRTNVSRHSVSNIIVPGPEGRSLKAHICRIGLFGLTSPRTRLSSGQGFALRAGEAYCVRPAPPDENGNLCSMHVFGTEDGSLRDIASPRRYQFGDKLLKPALRLTGFIDVTFGNNVFEEHMNRPNAYRFSSEEPGVRTDLQPATALSDRDIWGVFFEQTWRVGVRAYRDMNYITTDDLEMQEPYLFIGIPAVALMEMVLRSANDPDGLIIVDGRKITWESCAENFRQMLKLLMETKARFCAIPPLSSSEKVWLEQTLLFAGAAKITEGDALIQSGRKDELRNVFSNLMSVSTQLTQLECYKNNFSSVLDRILTWEPGDDGGIESLIRI